jgi:hypothetical protein
MRTVLAVLLSLSVSGAVAASLEEDVQKYVGIFSGDKSGHVSGAQSLQWVGISDTRVFDLVEQRLKADADAVRNDRAEKDRAAWYIRALGWSGDRKYEPTLSSFLGDRTYERYAKSAIEEMRRYQKWNPIISNRATFDPKLSDDANRVMNMLVSDDLQLKVLATKRILNGQHREEPLLERLAQEAKAGYTKGGDAETTEATASMLRALGSSRNPKYVALLEDAAKSSDRKIRNGAAAGLRYYR